MKTDLDPGLHMRKQKNNSTLSLLTFVSLLIIIKYYTICSSYQKEVKKKFEIVLYDFFLKIIAFFGHLDLDPYSEFRSASGSCNSAPDPKPW